MTYFAVKLQGALEQAGEAFVTQFCDCTRKTRGNNQPKTTT